MEADGKMSKWPNGQWNKEELKNYKNDLALLLQVLNSSPASGGTQVVCNFLNQERRLLDGKRGVLRIVFSARTNSS